MTIFKCTMCFKEIEKEYKRFLVQRKRKTIFDVNVALANLDFHVHALSKYIVGSVMVSSRREVICR